MISMKRLFKKTFIWVLALGVVAALVYRIKFMPVPVSIQPAGKAEIVAEVMGTGTLEARFQTTVSSKIQARIEKLFVDQNDHVTQGQLICQLDDAELRQEVGIAQATLQAAKSTVERVKAEDARSRAVMDQAQRDYQRYSALSETKVISQENVEKTRERLAIAEADVEKSAAAITEAQRQMNAAEQKLLYSEARLADTRILSPFDGLVIRRDRETGDVVVAGVSIFQIVSLRELWIAAWVDEAAMAGLQQGQPAWIVFRSEPRKRYKGRVARLGREVDRETREFRVDVTAEDLPGNWAVGQRAEVYIETGRKLNVFVVPMSALEWRQRKPGLFVVDNGRAMRRGVTVGLRGIDKIEISAGLSEKDRFVVDPETANLIDGQKVRPR
jgi:HlyD family secretion protein